MIKLKLYSFLFCIGLFYGVNGQDIHWSQFNDNQIFQNPGNTGHFTGDYRIIANYRQQWKSVTVPFTTLSFSGDTQLKKNKNIGLGALFFNDAAGDGKFRTVEFQTNASYLFKLTADSAHTIRPGINIGMNHRQVNWDQFKFDNQYNGAYYDPSLPSNELYQSQKNTSISIGLGVVYEYQLSARKKLTGGIGFYNLNQPDQGFFTETVKRDIRSSAFVKSLYELNDDWDLVPSISFQVQGKYRELIVGSSGKYTLINKLGQYKAVYFGAWFRNRDAGYLSAGLDYQSWFFGVSYDFNVSKLVPASHARGGIEFATRYIINRFKPKKIVHRICPDYI